MANYLRCKNCGYDLYGPEYLSNAIDPFAYSSDAYYPSTALLNLSTKPDKEIGATKKRGVYTSFFSGLCN